MFSVLKSLNREQRSVFVASFLGWTLDAFDFFLLTFVVADIAKDFRPAFRLCSTPSP